MTQATVLSTTLAAGLALCASPAVAVTVTFGSNNDGLGGFTQSTPPDSDVSWATATDSVTYTDTGATGNSFKNSSFLGSFVLDRSPGMAYTVTGVLTLTSGYADDNNRVGIYLFGDTAEIPSQNEVGAVGLIFNLDDGPAAGAPGTNADDNLALRGGIDNLVLSAVVARNEATTAYAQDLFGTQLTFVADIAFVGADIQIGASMTDADGDVTTIAPITVTAADYTGDFFGFVSRARNRGTDPGQNAPWTMDYESFSVEVVPEPGSLALLGLGGLCVFRRQRG